MPTLNDVAQSQSRGSINLSETKEVYHDAGLINQPHLDIEPNANDTNANANANAKESATQSVVSASRRAIEKTQAALRNRPEIDLSGLESQLDELSQTNRGLIGSAVVTLGAYLVHKALRRPFGITSVIVAAALGYAASDRLLETAKTGARKIRS